MFAIPANCITRRELQALISRSTELIGRASGELVSLLDDLCRSAAAIEGYLADVSVGERKPARSLTQALANPHGWEAVWVEHTITLHDRASVYSLKLSQQVVVSPFGGRRTATGRYGLTLDDEVVPPDTDKAKLLEVTRRYLTARVESPVRVGEFLNDVAEFIEALESSHAVRLEEPERSMLREEGQGAGEGLGLPGVGGEDRLRATAGTCEQGGIDVHD